jgi:co-chaperonin GroES (HSP10)
MVIDAFNLNRTQEKDRYQMASMQYEATKKETEEFELGPHIPKPVGWRLLISIPEVKDTTAGGIVIPDERRTAESTASIVGFVMAMGEDCYTDKKRFPSGSWCSVGDWVLIQSYAGTRINVDCAGGKKEFRIINDDSIDAVVENPEGISRV